jgi:hypothetical protein
MSTAFSDHGGSMGNAENECESWEGTDSAAALSYVEYLRDGVVRNVGSDERLSVGFKLRRQRSFLENRCEHHLEAIEEELLHEGLGSPFGPMGTKLSESDPTASGA